MVGGNEVDKENKWVVLESDLGESYEKESDEEGDEEELADGLASGMTSSMLADGLASGMTSGMVSGMVSGLTSGMASGMVSGISSSLPSGIETPSMIVNLRKESESEAPKQLYQVISYTRLEWVIALVGCRQKTLLVSDMVSGMVSDMVSGMVSDMVSGMVSDMVSGMVSDMVSGMVSDMVLEQKQANVGTGTLMGSDHTYVVPGSATVEGGKKDKKK
eukprot:gene5120-34924_t